MTELEIGVTFASASLKARPGSASASNSRQTAMHAYETALRFGDRISMERDEATRFTVRLGQLRGLLAVAFFDILPARNA
jgi:hypothetical protein